MFALPCIVLVSRQHAKAGDVRLTSLTLFDFLLFVAVQYPACVPPEYMLSFLPYLDPVVTDNNVAAGFCLHPVAHHQVKKAREAGTVDALTLKDKDTGLPFKVRAFMRLDRTAKVSTIQCTTLRALRFSTLRCAALH